MFKCLFKLFIVGVGVYISMMHLVVRGQLTDWSQFSLPPHGPGTETPNLKLREHLYPLLISLCPTSNA